MGIITNTPGSEALVEWAKHNQVSSKGLSSLQEALTHPQLESLHGAMIEADADSHRDDTATFLAALAQLQEKAPELELHYKATGVDFVAAWSLASPMRKNSQDPNEVRFYHWADAGTAEQFFAATVIGVRVGITYRRKFDVRSLHRWVVGRREHGSQFSTMAGDTFSVWRSPAEWMPPVDASRYDAKHCVALINELLEGERSRQSLAERIGISKQYLGWLINEKRNPSYGIQYCLEGLVGPVEPPVLKPPASKS